MVIVDDLVSSGTTLVGATRACRENGATAVVAAATPVARHGGHRHDVGARRTSLVSQGRRRAQAPGARPTRRTASIERAKRRPPGG